MIRMAERTVPPCLLSCLWNVTKSFARLAAVVVLIVSSGGCGAKYVAQTSLDETLEWYRAVLEKGEFDATGLLAADSIAREYQERARAAKDTRIVWCRILKVDYLEGAGEAEATIEVEYYSLLTLKAKTVRWIQKWVYHGDRGSSRWRLMTPLPLFS
jgi:hypothetical protein